MGLNFPLVWSSVITNVSPIRFLCAAHLGPIISTTKSPLWTHYVSLWANIHGAMDKFLSAPFGFPMQGHQKPTWGSHGNVGWVGPIYILLASQRRCLLFPIYSYYSCLRDSYEIGTSENFNYD